jgi:hypothetical protein
MANEFDMKRITSPLLLHMLRWAARLPIVFLLSRKLTDGRFEKQRPGAVDSNQQELAKVT